MHSNDKDIREYQNLEMIKREKMMKNLRMIKVLRIIGEMGMIKNAGEKKC